ncbi:MAG TPA: hypothetical protein VNY05_37570 [Candidatus Acidoferrales bacterium]|jgi:hypothetical protein|nr:hypothetical protein [Candidatus Acidoferrales bacterium]
MVTQLADITGDNAVHPIVLGSPARWLRFTLIGSGTARIGDSTITAGLGIPLVASVAGEVFVTPFIGEFARYQAAEFYAYVPTGATLSVAYYRI